MKREMWRNVMMVLSFCMLLGSMVSGLYVEAADKKTVYVMTKFETETRLEFNTINEFMRFSYNNNGMVRSMKYGGEGSYELKIKYKNGRPVRAVDDYESTKFIYDDGILVGTTNTAYRYNEAGYIRKKITKDDKSYQDEYIYYYDDKGNVKKIVNRYSIKGKVISKEPVSKMSYDKKD